MNHSQNTFDELTSLNVVPISSKKLAMVSGGNIWTAVMIGLARSEWKHRDAFGKGFKEGSHLA
ncbi:MAG: hypothetical protein L0G20_03240 [Lactobacillus sp.]|nr:hypothetical protein [Lactobacillus sp.]